jgi:hypothetical protein
MSARSVAALGVVLGCVVGCSTSVAIGTDAGPLRGEPGSPVWFESSTAIQVTRAWGFDSWGPDAGPPQSGASCATFVRTEMTSDQLAALEAIVLVPATDSCPYDGYQYTELTVLDRDGSSAVYRDTGCNYPRVAAAATVMLPQGALSATTFPTDSTAACN